MKRLEIIALATILPTILGASIFIKPNSQQIIYANLIDVSESALNNKLKHGQTYKSLIKDNCLSSLDLLNTNDVYIAGEFTTEVNSESHVIKYIEKNSLMDGCSERTDLKARMRKQQGTSLKVAIDRLELEVAKQRAQHINYPIAAVITIDANETEPGAKPENLKSIVKKIKNMLDKEHLKIAFVGPESNLQKQLNEQLKSTDVKIASFEHLNQITADTIASARKLPSIK
jgi:hypothetical protein